LKLTKDGNKPNIYLSTDGASENVKVFPELLRMYAPGNQITATFETLGNSFFLLIFLEVFYHYPDGTMHNGSSKF
jgi:hypothetical protein